MRYVVMINQSKCLAHGITAAEGALMDLFNQLASWADEQLIENEVYYFLSRSKVIEEIPFFYAKPDTVYRAFVKLKKKKLIKYTKVGKRDYVRFTMLGKTWNKSAEKLGNKSEFAPNSEINPSKFGNKPEFHNTTSAPVNIGILGQNSDLNPTDNIYKEIKDNSIIEILKKIQSENPMIFDMILSDRAYHERLVFRLNSLKLKVDFKKEITPILIKWLCDSWTGAGLNSTGGKLQTKCTSYVIAVVSNGGLKTGSKNKDQAVLSNVRKKIRYA